MHGCPTIFRKFNHDRAEPGAWGYQARLGNLSKNDNRIIRVARLISREMRLLSLTYLIRAVK